MQQINDIEYIEQGLFTSFVPVSADGEKLWLELINQNSGSGKILTIHAKSVIEQIKKAGYNVGKARKISEKEFQKFIKELEF